MNNPMKMKALPLAIASVLGSGLLVSPMASHAMVIYDTWTSVNDPSPGGNYIVTATHNDLTSMWDINFTVNPWNAEGLGLFIDWGNIDINAGDVNLVNNFVDPPQTPPPGGWVTFWDSDTTSNGCGPGCNLNGLAPALPPDGEWELVFRLANQGYDGIQTFNFSINDYGLTDMDWGIMGVRAQQLCSGTNLLPDGSCGGSDKSYGTVTPTPTPTPVPTDVSTPGTLGLFGVGLLAVGALRNNRRSRT